jgi:hypothetical protein
MKATRSGESQAVFQDRVRTPLAARRGRLCTGHTIPVLAFTLCNLLLPVAAKAGLILSINPISLSASAGGTVTFMGAITNDTGAALSATDLFLNFNGFDPTNLPALSQLLGSPDFSLPDSTTSAVVDLFLVQVAPTAAAGPYPIDVSVEDVNNNLSNDVTVTVNVTGSVIVPETSSVVLAVAGLLLTAVARRCQNCRRAGSAWKASPAQIVREREGR